MRIADRVLLGIGKKHDDLRRVARGAEHNVIAIGAGRERALLRNYKGRSENERVKERYDYRNNEYGPAVRCQILYRGLAGCARV
jgi:aminoglycoside phosphotransferase